MPYKSGEYSATTRRLRLFDYLRGKRLPTPLAELMAEFGVSDDTIRRDLHDIADAGYAIDYSRDDNRSGQTMVLMRSATFLDVPITREEAHTFAGSRRLWEPLKGTPFYDNFENLYRKVVETLPAKERTEIERDRTRFFCIPDGGVLPYDDKRSIVETLRLGAMNRRQVKYVYRTRGGKYRTGTCEPFAIGVYKNTIYVLARLVPSPRAVASGAPQHLSWVSWPAHRFTEASLLRQEFSVPPTFKLEDHFDGWGIISGDDRERVVLEFDAEVAPLIAERRWHPSQTVDALPAGGVRLVPARALHGGSSHARRGKRIEAPRGHEPARGSSARRSDGARRAGRAGRTVAPLLARRAAGGSEGRRAVAPRAEPALEWQMRGCGFVPGSGSGWGQGSPPKYPRSTRECR